MGTPLKLKDANGNFQEMTTSEENYLAYQIGIHLSLGDSAEPGALSKLANTSVGTFSNTFFNEPVGTHPSTSITTGTTNYPLYQRTGTAAETDSDWTRPLEWVDSGGETGFKEMDDTSLNEAVDRYLSTIFTNDYPGTYKVGSSSPGAGYSLVHSNVFTDTRTDGTSTQYNLYQRTSYTAPAAVVPTTIKTTSPIAIQGMTERQIRQTFGQRAKTRINASKIGTYQIRSATQGAPTDPGTWVSAGAVTDTKQQTSDQVYTTDFTQQFQATYTRNYQNQYQLPFTRIRQDTTFERNYTTNYANIYTSNFTRLAAETFDTNYIGTFETPYIGTFESTYTGTYVKNYTKHYQRYYTSQYENEGINYSRLYENVYDRAYSSTYNKNYVAYYISIYSNTYERNFTGAINYDIAYERARIQATNYNINYTASYLGGPYTTSYERGYLANYLPTYVSVYAQGPYTRVFNKSYVQNYTGDTQPFYARAQAESYVATYVSGPYTRNYVTRYLVNYTRALGFSPGNYASSFEVNYINPEYLSQNLAFSSGIFQVGYLANLTTYTGIQFGAVPSDNFFMAGTYDGYAGTGAVYVGGPDVIGGQTAPAVYIPSGFNGYIPAPYQRDYAGGIVIYNNENNELSGLPADYVRERFFVGGYQPGITNTGVNNSDVFNVWQSLYYALGSSIDGGLDADGAPTGGLSMSSFAGYYNLSYVGENSVEYVKKIDYVGPGIFNTNYLGPGAANAANYIGTGVFYDGPGTSSYTSDVGFDTTGLPYIRTFATQSFYAGGGYQSNYITDFFYDRVGTTLYYTRELGLAYLGPGSEQVFQSPSAPSYLGDQIIISRYIGPTGTFMIRANAGINPTSANIPNYSQAVLGQMYQQSSLGDPTGESNMVAEQFYQGLLFFSGSSRSVSYTKSVPNYYTGGNQLSDHNFLAGLSGQVGAGSFNAGAYMPSYISTTGGAAYYEGGANISFAGYDAADTAAVIRVLGTPNAYVGNFLVPAVLVGINDVAAGQLDFTKVVFQAPGGAKYEVIYFSPDIGSYQPIGGYDGPASYTGSPQVYYQREITYTREILSSYLGPAGPSGYYTGPIFNVNYVRDNIYSIAYTPTYISAQSYSGPGVQGYATNSYIGPQVPQNYGRQYTNVITNYDAGVTFYQGTEYFDGLGGSDYIRLYNQGDFYTSPAVGSIYAARFGGPAYQRFYDANFIDTYTGNVVYTNPYDRDYLGVVDSQISYDSTLFTGYYTSDYQGFLTLFYAQLDSGYIRNYTRVDPNQLNSYLGEFNALDTYDTLYNIVYDTGYTAVNYNTAYEGNYQNEYSIYADYTTTYVDDPIYTGTYNKPYTSEYNNPYNRAYQGPLYTSRYTGGYANAYNPQYTSVFSALYDKIYTQVYEEAYVGTFETTYAGTYERTYAGTYEGIYTSVYEGAFVGQYDKTYVGTYTANYTSVYTGTYTQDYQQDYIKDYTGNFIGDFAGLTIQATSETNETYTLYVRIA